jgi:hypothetical protein
MSTNLNFTKYWKKWAKITYLVYFFIYIYLFMYPQNLGKLNLAILKRQKSAVSRILESFNS